MLSFEKVNCVIKAQQNKYKFLFFKANLEECSKFKLPSRSQAFSLLNAASISFCPRSFLLMRNQRLPSLRPLPVNLVCAGRSVRSSHLPVKTPLWLWPYLWEAAAASLRFITRPVYAAGFLIFSKFDSAPAVVRRRQSLERGPGRRNAACCLCGVALTAGRPARVDFSQKSIHFNHNGSWWGGGGG